MKERRKEKRTEVKNTITVLDGATGSPLGTLVNISLHGIGIKGTVKIHPDTEMEIILIVDKTKFGVEKIHIKARCAWTHTEPGTSNFQSGFEFINVLYESTNIILDIVLDQD